MKSLCIAILVVLSTFARGDSYLFIPLPGLPDLKGARVEGNRMHFSVEVKRLPNPKVGGIVVERNEDGNVIVRTFLKDKPEEGWIPLIKLGDQILQTASVTSMSVEYASYFDIKFTEQDEAIAAARSLSKLFGIPEQRVVIDDSIRVQDGKTDSSKVERGQPDN